MVVTSQGPLCSIQLKTPPDAGLSSGAATNVLPNTMKERQMGHEQRLAQEHHMHLLGLLLKEALVGIIAGF